MIVLKNIGKEFGGKKILDQISFHISKNENVGIIGLNGAGKTTLLNIISGMLKPDEGFIRVNGVENPMEQYSVLQNISYISGTRTQLWEDLKIKDSFENCMQMYQVERNRARKQMEILNEVFEITPFMHATPQNLSLGERMRCELVYGLLAEPEIFLLDEAMIGLDVSIKYKILQYFEQYKKEKKSTMIFTSHNLAEVERLCDRVILLDKGKIIFDGSTRRMQQEFAPLYHMEVRIAGGLPDFEDLPLDKFFLEKDVLDIVFDKQKIETAQILRHIMARCEIKDIKLHEPNLEGTIQKIYKREE